MSRIRIVAAVLVAALVAGVAAAAAATKAPKLNGAVGPDSSFKITLTQSGKPVKTLKAGKYTFVIKDTASVHNFHLSGPGVNKATSTEGKGTSTWNLTLKKGTYKYVCDPHSTIMKGSFTVK
jgi:plastocyanin